MLRAIFGCQTVSSTNEPLKKRLETVVNLAVTTVSSLAQSFSIVAPASHEDMNLEKEPVKAVVIPTAKALSGMDDAVNDKAGKDSEGNAETSTLNE